MHCGIGLQNVAFANNATDLEAHWLFDEDGGTTVFDSTGNGNTGSLKNGPAWTTGWQGSALSFDGTDDYVDVGAVDCGTTGLSLAVWFRADNLANCSSRDCRLLSKATGTAEDDHYVMLSTIDSGGATRLRFRLKTEGVTSTLKAGAGDLSPGVWTHAAAVYDGNEMRIYKDGVLVGSQWKTGAISQNEAVPFWIGGNPPSATSRPWAGQIDDVRIYTRDLSDEEVLAVYNGEDVVPDTTPPSVPGNLMASGVEATQAVLAWDESSDSESGISSYRIFRDDVLVGQSGTTSFTDQGLEPGQMYLYEVTAVNGAGLESLKSDSLSVTTKVLSCEDTDADGYGVCPDCGVEAGCLYEAEDCDDSDPAVNPGAAEEICGDGIDNNCDGQVDEGCFGDDPENDTTSLLVTVTRPSDYSVTNLQEGIEYYNDRSYLLISLPQSLTGGDEQLIITSNNDKRETAENFLEFTISKQAKVYIAYDSRASSLPSWLENHFTLTSMFIEVSDTKMGSFNVYEATYGAGTIQLGGNSASGAVGVLSNYIVLIAPDAESAIDTTPPDPPANLTLSEVGATHASLVWDETVDIESGINLYRIYRDNVLVGQSGTSDYADTGLEPAHTFIYQVTAVNGAGLESESSNSLSVDTETGCADADADGYGVCPDCGVGADCLYEAEDCDDSDPAVNPGVAEEICGDGIDNNCDAQVDEACSGDDHEDDTTSLLVTVTRPSDYSVIDLQEGIEYYNDRSYLLTSLPQSLTGGDEQLIITSNNDKRETAEDFLEFTISKQAKVYIAYDSRASSLPSWLENNFILTSMFIKVNDTDMVSFNVYEATYEAGTIQLGGNSASGAVGALSNYIVLITPDAESAIDTTPPDPPANLTLSEVGATHASLVWDEAFDIESGINLYRIYRDNVLVGQSETTSFTDSGLDPGQMYIYAVTAVNDVGLESAKSVSLEVTTDFLSSGPAIDIWYGGDQTFGQLGMPQPWVNILGKVIALDEVASLAYSLNDGPEISLPVGPDGRRLEEDGDFNVEIHYTDLQPGQNQIILTAVDTYNEQTTRIVQIDYVNGNIWPNPYEIDWNSVNTILDAAQPVDGLWTLEGDTVRTAVPGYDRLLAIGDLTWDDYEITVPITFHGLMGPGNSPGLGILMRWQGHLGDRDPRIEWSGVIGWYRFSSGGYLQLLGSKSLDMKDFDSLKLSTGNRYIYKMRVETTSDQRGRYSLKVWKDGDPVPDSWQLVGVEDSSNNQTGSLLLLAHRLDASFGRVTIVPVQD